ncbi:MAG: hypothetical protein NE328_10700 [Lentisphaeraceae bacterium]|nr:hypothetical protein [Lentisphaeraceae bacterium]
MHNKISELNDLSAEDAEKVYRKAVELLKKDNPTVFLKGLMTAGVGGGVGVLLGSILKDLVFRIPGMNLKAFIVLGFCAISGGILGGLLVSTQLERKIKSHIPEARKELQL